MQNPPDISDPSDWIGSALQPLKNVESALRCQICKEFFQTPMVTSCSHTFCSLCIRRCIAAEGKCPACRTKIDVIKLYKNTAIEDIVEAFQEARPELLSASRNEQLSTSDNSKRRADESLDEPRAKSQRQTRSQHRYQRTSSDSHSTKHDQGEADISLDEPLREGFSRCPICNQEMRIELVYSHLDSHNSDQPTKTNSLARREHIQVQRPELVPLPNINYSIMKEKDLRKKLSDLGISQSGSRTALQKRHTEYLNMWNANCDAINPKSKHQLLRDLELWERSQGAPSSQAQTMRKDFDGQAWSIDHNPDFQRLIAQARSKVSHSPSDDKANSGEEVLDSTAVPQTESSTPDLDREPPP